MGSGSHHHEIAVRAYELWEARGAPIGSPDVDWFQAEALVAAAHATEPGPVFRLTSFHASPPRPEPDAVGAPVPAQG